MLYNSSPILKKIVSRVTVENIFQLPENTNPSQRKLSDVNSL